MRAGGGADDQVEASAASERLSGLGLPQSSAGWVPKQPESLRTQPDAAPSRTGSPAAQTPTAPEPGSIGELIRAAVADRAPVWASGLIERATIGGVATAVAVLLVVVVGGIMLVHRQHPAGASYSSSRYSNAADSPAPDPVPSAAGDAASIVIDVGGRVRKPGLVTLPAGARVADAIDAAGGPLRRRELDRIDLAQRVTDGQFLLIGVRPDASAAGAATTPTSAGSSAPISLSTATLDQLETLPGVGPVTAQKIIDWRTANGGFTSVEQLQQVSGIGPAHYAEISPLVTP